MSDRAIFAALSRLRGDRGGYAFRIGAQKKTLGSPCPVAARTRAEQEEFSLRANVFHRKKKDPLPAPPPMEIAETQTKKQAGGRSGPEGGIVPLCAAALSGSTARLGDLRFAALPGMRQGAPTIFSACSEDVTEKNGKNPLGLRLGSQEKRLEKSGGRPKDVPKKERQNRSALRPASRSKSFFRSMPHPNDIAREKEIKWAAHRSGTRNK